ncbi:MAG: hypothetical protein P1P74_11730 [Desulfuromonadales bacterium]|nr:hypothetical protein [Desulfuromonadales bacterium]
MKERFLYIFCFVFFIVSCHNAFARQSLIGAVNLDYVSYTEEEGALKDNDSHFAQHLDLSYKNNRSLMGGRLGFLTLELGAELSRLHTTDDINHGNSTIDTRKLLYNFDLKMAPQGLPFRLNIFARDDKFTFFEKNISYKSAHRLLDKSIYSDIGNGSRHTLGATLLLGIRNGSYLGKYREMLSTLPRLLMDYKQTITKDLKSLTPTHTRSRDLAFVSLNKKDNWLHYRLYDFIDYFDSRNDFERKQVILGVIDPSLNRKWINLTNWIKLSTDVGYTRETSAKWDAGLIVHSYHLNLFTVMTRPQLSVNNFSSYRRSRLDESFGETLDVPIYVFFEENVDSKWRFNWTTNLDRDMSGLITQQETVDHYARVDLDTWRTRNYKLSLGAGAEHYESLSLKRDAVEVSWEVWKNQGKRRSGEKSNDCGLHLTSSWGKSEPTIGGAIKTVTMTALARYQQTVSRYWTLGLKGTSRYVDNSGSQAGGAENSRIAADNVRSLDGSPINTKTTLTSTLRAFAEHTLTRDFLNRVDAKISLLDAEDVRQKNYQLKQKLIFRKRHLQGYFSNSVEWGDVGANSAEAFVAAQSGLLFVHDSRVSYRPSREVEANFSYGMKRQKIEGDGEIVSNTFVQEAKYSTWVTNGVIRKVFDFGEKLEWESFSQDNRTRRAASFTINYYPLQTLFLGGSVSYTTESLDHRDDIDSIVGSVWAGVNYSKFKLNVNYSYGLRPETDDKEERMESRFQVQVTKVI